MSNSKLWIHVVSGIIKDPDNAPVYVYLRVAEATNKTGKATPPNPQWNYNCVFDVEPNDVFGSVILELYKTRLFVLSDLMGVANIPLASVRHSNKKGEGVWHKLLLPSSNSTPEPTEHQLLVDLHFELPPDLPEDVAEILDKKLRQLDNVLQHEVEIIERQQQKIVQGELAPPTELAHVPSSPIPPSSPYSSHPSLESPQLMSLSPSPEPPLESSLIHQMRNGSDIALEDSTIELQTSHTVDVVDGYKLDSPQHYRDNFDVVDGYKLDSPRHYRDNSFNSDDLNFPGFEWECEDKSKRYSLISLPAGSLSPRHLKKRSDNGASSRGSPPLRRRRSGSKESPLIHSHTVDLHPGRHQRNASLDLKMLHPASASMSQLDNSKRSGSVTLQVPLLSDSRQENGASAVAKKRGLRRSQEVKTIDFDHYGSHSSLSSQGSATDQHNSHSSKEDKHIKYVALWKKAFDHHLPEIQQRLKSEENKLAGLSGSGVMTLVALVNQLQGYKKLSEAKNQLEDNINYFSSMNTEFRSRSRSVIDVKKIRRNRKHFIDEDIRIHVYKRTVEALIYPASEPDSHMFETWSARKPTNCSECSSLLWGLHKQGVKCLRCGKICHERCSTLVSQDCFIHDQEVAIKDKMHRMEVNHANRFKLLKEAFNVPPREHDVIINETKEKILQMAKNFSAEVTVKVIASQGLQLKESDHKIYVSVAVGNNRKRTRAYKRTSTDKVPPFWNEEFSFLCYNYHDPIQIRVWVERDTALSRMAQRLTKEGDTFIGEKIIEVRRIGPPQDVWYKLEKRTANSPEVCGYLKLSIAALVEGDKVVTTFHQQYMKLHEQLFLHCHLNNYEPLVSIPDRPCGGDGVSSLKFLPSVSQEIIEEFALRYSVESIFRMMVHIELLVNHHSLSSALTMIENLLKSLKFKMFLHVAADHASRAVGATVLMEEYMDASNFGRDNFSRLLEKLMTSLKLDLQQYREFYPPHDQQKLAELMETCQLMDTVLEFQQQAMGFQSNFKLEHLILENMKECVKSTFDFIVQNSMTEQNSNRHPGLSKVGTPFQFFYTLLKQIKCVINEDRKVYAPCISKFCSFNLGDVSAGELWRWFVEIIDGLFDDPANLKIHAPKEYISLFFIVQGLYESEIRRVPMYKDVTPEYPRWFLPCGKQWLAGYLNEGITFVDNAWEDDKTTFHFASHEQQEFTSSSYQMFFYLHHGLEFVQGLGQEDKDVHTTYLEVFAEVIKELVQHYVDKISSHIPVYVSELETACMLLNNIQSLRVNVQALFSQMGGENAGPKVTKILQDFQSRVLSKELTSWCTFVARSLTPYIMKEVGTLQTELLKLKGQSGVERKQVKVIVRPLLDMLTEKARTIAVTCEQGIMSKVIKEVWYICLNSLHRMLLPMMKWEQQEGVQTSLVQFPKYHYTGRQCTALDMTMDILKDFFSAAGSQGVKLSTIEKGLKQLKGVIGLYRETTEMLITDFIYEETSGGAQATEVFCGEVFVEIDAYSHPTTGELEGLIRVMSATNLSLEGVSNQALKPFIELHLISPSVTTSSRRVFKTGSKSGTSPNFNENFKFSLANWENSELQVVAKNYATFGFGKDKIIGIAVIPVSLVIKDPSLTLGLSPQLNLSDRGQAILNVLSVRTFDNFAKEFVALKEFHQKAVSMEGVDQV